MREIAAIIQNQLKGFSAFFTTLPGLFNYAKEATEKTALINSFLRDLSELSTTLDTEIYFRRMKNEAYGQIHNNSDYIIEKLQERLLKVRSLVLHRKYTWREIRSHCRMVDIGFDDLHDFVISVNRFPDYGEAICIRHFGLREIIKALQESNNC